MQSNSPATVISRGLYAASEDHCLYVIKFEHLEHNTFFVVHLIKPTTWHFNAIEPSCSYFEKKVGEELVRFPISECIVQCIDGNLTTIVNELYIQGVCIGLGRVPSDMECYTAIVQQVAVNDDQLLARKRENQQREKNNELP